MKVSALLLCGTLSVAGCVTVPKKGPAPASGPFPTTEAVEQVLATALETPAREAFDPDEWKVAKPATEVMEAASGDDPLQPLLARAVVSRGGRAFLSEGASCLARELVDMFVEGEPATDLVEWVRARCLLWSPDFVTVLVPATEAAVRAAIDAHVAATTDEVYEVGIAASGNAARIVIAKRLARVEVQGLDSGRVHIEGEVFVDAEEVTALVGRGRFGVAPCMRRESVRLPEFELTCDTDGEDEWAWIEITARTLSDPDPHRIASLLAGKPGIRYHRPEYVRELSSEASTLRAQLTDMLNQVRAEGYLDPVRQSDPQSDWADRLASHIRGPHDRNPDVHETIRMSALAGRELVDTLRYGRVTTTTLSADADPARVLASLLERPTGRVVWLDPDVREIAVGTATEGTHRRVVAGGYAVLADGGIDKRAELVWQRIDEQRARANKGKARRIRGLDADAARAIELLEKEGATPGRAIQVFTQRATHTLGRRANGWYLEVSSLDDFEVPARLVEAPLLDMQVAVAYATGGDSAWGRYVILVVTVAAIPT